MKFLFYSKMKVKIHPNILHSAIIEKKKIPHFIQLLIYSIQMNIGRLKLIRILLKEL